MATVNFVHFDNVTSFSRDHSIQVWGSDFPTILPISHGSWKTRFEDSLLCSLKEDQYYIFIIAVNQYNTWDEHVEKFGLAKYIVYKNPCPIMNINYDPGERLKLFILKFDSEFVKKWSKEQ